MGESFTMYEVRVSVEVGDKEYKPIPYSTKVKGYYGKVEWVCDRIVKMFHIEARTPSKARAIARAKYGEPISCRKVDALSSLSSIEKLKLDQPLNFGDSSSYKNAISMDEMVWQKRNKRRGNLYKDKKGLTT